MKAGIIVAMSSEYDALMRAGLDTVALSGIGKVNAAATATEMILRQKPDCIINSGCAGSVRNDVEMFDIVLGRQTAHHDVWCGEPNEFGVVEGCPKRFDADPQLLALAESLELEQHLHSGLICSGDQFFISMEEDRRILRLYPDCLACDMESAAIAQVCARYGVPFLSLRIISDVHTSVEAQKASYSDFWGQLAGSSFNVMKQLIEKI